MSDLYTYQRIKNLKKLSDNPDNNYYGLNEMAFLVGGIGTGTVALFSYDKKLSQWFRTSNVVEITQDTSNNSVTFKTLNSTYYFEYEIDNTEK